MKYALSEHLSFYDALLTSRRTEENLKVYNTNATVSINLLAASLDNSNFANTFNETFTGIFYLCLLFYRATFIYIIRVYFTI